MVQHPMELKGRQNRFLTSVWHGEVITCSGVLPASYPGILTFFNVCLQEKSGRPGRFGDVMITYLAVFQSES